MENKKITIAKIILKSALVILFFVALIRIILM